MSEGTEYPKVVTGPGGVKHTVKNAAEEEAWVNAPLPPGYVPLGDASPSTGSFGASPMVELPTVKVPTKKGKGATDA